MNKAKYRAITALASKYAVVSMVHAYIDRKDTFIIDKTGQL